MSCYSCSSEFSFLKREVGCDVCGFAFCSRCCKKRNIQSKEGDIKKHACNKCFESSNGEQVKTSKLSPPLAHKKRMETFKKRAYSVDTGSKAAMSTQWSCEKDKEIAERLQKLKEGRIKDALPSEDEIANRLAKLKGIDPSKYNAPPIEVYRRPDMRTSIEQASDLLKQVTLEAELDSRLVKPEDEIAARLARLRDEDPEKAQHSKELPPKTDFKNLKTEHSSEEMDIDQVHVAMQAENQSISEVASKGVSDLMNDPEYKALMMSVGKNKDREGVTEEELDQDEEEANKLVEKLLATDVEELDSLDDTEDTNSKSEKDTTEEFPWCVICTENAKIRCFDCDSDIYCLRCFKECHDSLDIKDHRTCPYLPVKDSAL